MRHPVPYGPEPGTVHPCCSRRTAARTPLSGHSCGSAGDGGPGGCPRRVLRRRTPDPRPLSWARCAPHGRPAAVLAPRIHGVPARSADAELLTDPARTRDGAWLTHLVGGARRVP
ncbi:hypothetical protein GCM10010365_61170 [Streptomyces poonensis]|uniref:Uncharacterized protein n=1 Tax=Streptomyces poonensis TaxID=68255 RepID=A0A918Q4Y2_9ACTN|nr:hypothetical protein GCM10010365_61170 [Streptomyces poonensis]GLJ92786.1 hypothetical protein GCM10017589_53960 [Streptomyces poonensis]